MSPISPKQSTDLSWHKVEGQIQKEIIWLRTRIDTFLEEGKNSPINCKNCLLRSIALLIVSGTVQSREIQKHKSLKAFWSDQTKTPTKRIYHGSDWHRLTMEKIESHFLAQNFKVIREPTLQYGRADLGIYKKGETDLLVEVGTISLFKLWVNLKMMRNFVYLIVPNDAVLIEFTHI